MRAAVFAAAILLVVPSAAAAGIDLSWNPCVTNAPADGVSNLYANFQLPSAIDPFVALDAVQVASVAPGGESASSTSSLSNAPGAFRIESAPQITAVYGGSCSDPVSCSQANAPTEYPASLEVHGSDFDPLGTTQLEKAGLAPIPGTELRVPPSRTDMFTATYDVTGAVTGYWDLRYTSPDGITAVRPGAVLLYQGPHIDSIEPAQGPNTVVQPVVVHGRNFAGSIFLRLYKWSPPFDQAEPVGTPVVSSDGRTITASMDLRGKLDGLYEVYLVRTDVGYPTSLPGAFQVVLDGPVATLLSRFDARRVAGGMEVRWQFTEPDLVREATAERSPTATGPWTALAGAQPDGSGGMMVRDPGATSGTTFYRLVATTTDGEPLTFGPIEADAGPAAPTRSALESIAPNPVRNTTRIRLSLAREGRVQVTVHDLLGREVARLADGVSPVGPLELTWNPGAGSLRLPGGLYFLRFEAADVRQTRRVVLTP